MTTGQSINQDSSQTTIKWAGIDLHVNVPEGEFFTVSREGEDVTVVRKGDGGKVIATTSANGGSISIQIFAHAPNAKQLHAVLRAQQQTKTTFVAPLVVRDNVSKETTTYQATNIRSEPHTIVSTNTVIETWLFDYGARIWVADPGSLNANILQTFLPSQAVLSP